MEDKRKKRQEELALVFYEMGMEDDLAIKISGIEKSEYALIKQKKQTKNLDTKSDNAYNE